MFDLYAVLLMVSGLLLIVAAFMLAGQRKGGRILNGVIGLAFFGYGFYLEFLFTGGTYRIFFYAFVVPVLLLIQAFRARKEAQARTAQPVPPVAADSGTPATPPQG